MKRKFLVLLACLVLQVTAFSQKSISGCAIGGPALSSIKSALIAGVNFNVQSYLGSDNRICKIVATGYYDQFENGDYSNNKRQEIINALGNRFGLLEKKNFLLFDDRSVLYTYKTSKKVKSNSLQNNALEQIRGPITPTESNYEYDEVQGKASISLKYDNMNKKFIITIQDGSSSTYNDF